MKKIISSITMFTCACILFYSCKKDGAEIESKQIPSDKNNSSRVKTSKRVYVANVAELYAGINDTDNAGATIVIAPGTYLLSANYPKAGRLELLRDMSLVGQPGKPEAVIIDATALPLSSFTIAPANSRTGVVRTGDGDNSIEWITFQNDPAHTIRSLIQTDIIATPITQLRIAHCIIKGSSIGVSIVNREPSANGRIIEAQLEDNEIMNNVIPQFGSGIQVQNSMAVNDAIIRLTLRGNYIHDNKAGILAFNASSQRSTVEISSHNDKVEKNGLGLMFNGGFIENANNPALDNSLKFEAHATSVKNNSGQPAPPFAFPAGGIHAAGAQAMPPFAPAGTSHNNKLEVSLFGCEIANNVGAYQISAFGAHSFHASLSPAGTNNTTAIYVNGLSTKASINAVASFPWEAAGTNTINVYK